MAGVTPTHTWNLPDPLDADLAALARELDVPELGVEVLYRRGLRTAEDIRAFLDPSPGRLLKPDTLPDIEAATARVLTALDKGETVCVHGDYDVDGVTGTVLLVTVLRSLGGRVTWYLPDRETEGYGLSLESIPYCREHGVTLLLSNDCGSSDHETVEAAKAAGIDVVVTDHHEVPDELPGALAVVNPKRPDSQYPFSELAGVGVAFKLAWSVLSALDRPRSELTDLLDLVGLGTIADVVPMLGENRVLARLGLNAIRTSPRPGLQALLDKTRLAGKALSSTEVGFRLAPRLNAAGRVSHAREAAELLLTGDPAEAARIADDLEMHNRSRQALEEATLRQATEIVERLGLQQRRVIVVARDEWPDGVLGLVASKLVERYYRPAIAIALSGESGKGSGRSIRGFDLYASLQAGAGHLETFGGHKYACGLRVAREELPAFADAINRFADQLPGEIYLPSMDVDAVVDINSIDDSVVQVLERMGPFGPGNRTPVFAGLGLEVVGLPRRVGRGHLKLRVRSDGRSFDAIAWGRSSDLPGIEPDRPGALDICFTVDRNTWGGRTSTQLTLRDLRSSGKE